MTGRVEAKADGCSAARGARHCAARPADASRELRAGANSEKLLLAVLGAGGEHARTVVPTPVLPLHRPVEVQVIFSIRSLQDTPTQKEGL